MSLKDKYAIVGLGLTKQGKALGCSADELAAQAILKALEDSGMRKDEVDGYIYQAGIGGPNNVVPLRMAGIPSKFQWQLEAASTTGISSVAAAIGALDAGLCQACILVHATSPSSMLGKGGPAGEQRSTNGAYGRYGPPVAAAFIARRYMHLYGLTRRQLGSISVTLREYANKRPDAVMYDRPMTIDDYLNARMIVDPICMFDCCLVNDGAVALIITSAERAKNYKKPPVYVMGYGIDMSMRLIGQSPQAILHFDGFDVRAAKENAFKMAGITLKDVDVAEMYDAFTIFLLSQLEAYGICGKGEGGPFVEAGNLRLDGAWPSNTSGTELSWSYIQGFTHLTEGVRQMRGEAGECQVKNAEICMVTGLGGNASGSSMACCLLRR
jgi:acetyl-CoA acetyltransferase